MQPIRIDLELKSPRSPLPKNTPLETKRLKTVLLTYEDDTTLLLEILEDQGYHRVNNYNNKLITHEIFITYGVDE